MELKWNKKGGTGNQSVCEKLPSGKTIIFEVTKKDNYGNFIHDNGYKKYNNCDVTVSLKYHLENDSEVITFYEGQPAYGQGIEYLKNKAQEIFDELCNEASNEIYRNQIVDSLLEEHK